MSGRWVREPLDPEADYLGVILPGGTVDLAPLVEGRLAHVYVHEGDTFKKGALLALLEGGTARHDPALREAPLQSMQAGQELLRAPFDGVVASRLVDKGALVKPGQVLMWLLRSGVQCVRFTLPKAQAHQVSVGQRVLVTPQAQTPVLAGRVSHVSPEVDTAARRVFGLAELEPTSTAPTLPSGTVVRVRPLFEQTAHRWTP